MWDNHRLLNALANALIACAALLAAGGALKLVVESALFPLRTIRIEGDLVQVRRGDVVATLQGRLAGTFFNMDIDAARALFETIPWVRRAHVRRVWPDRLEVRMEEHVPLAHWSQPDEGRWVNTFGEVFSAPPRADQPVLPQFSGPAGTSAQVTRRYAAFRQILAPLGLQPSAVALSARHSWQLRLSSGLTVQLGRESDKDRIADRLARFAAIYPRALASLSRKLDYVDLRYVNGFALRVAGLKDAASASPKPSRSRPQERKKSA